MGTGRRWRLRLPLVLKALHKLLGFIDAKVLLIPVIILDMQNGLFNRCTTILTDDLVRGDDCSIIKRLSERL